MQNNRHECLEVIFEILKSFPEPEYESVVAQLRARDNLMSLIEQVKHG